MSTMTTALHMRWQIKGVIKWIDLVYHQFWGEKIIHLCFLMRISLNIILHEILYKFVEKRYLKIFVYEFQEFSSFHSCTHLNYFCYMSVMWIFHNENLDTKWFSSIRFVSDVGWVFLFLLWKYSKKTLKNIKYRTSTIDTKTLMKSFPKFTTKPN